MKVFITTIVIFLLSFNSGYAEQDKTSHIPYFQLRSLKSMRFEGIDKQTLDYSCGAASLSILLTSYFNERYSEKALLEDIIFRLSDAEMEVRFKEGFSMLDLKLLAERLGYSAIGANLTHEAVMKLKGPVIVLLKKSNLYHFVVLKAADQDSAFIADPVAGHMRLPLHEFFSQWDGETLILGRPEFGLPQVHGLVIPTGRSVAPEKETIRTLKYTPFNRRRLL